VETLRALRRREAEPPHGDDEPARLRRSTSAPNSSGDRCASLCEICGATSDLTADHVTAIAAAGALSKL
jgi:hypothetical protein